MFLSIYMIMLDVFLRTLWHYDYRTLEYSTMMPFHWEYDHSGHIGLSYDLHGSSRSHRYLLQVACNCSPLVIIIIIMDTGHFLWHVSPPRLQNTWIPNSTVWNYLSQGWSGRFPLVDRDYRSGSTGESRFSRFNLYLHNQLSNRHMWYINV